MNYLLDNYIIEHYDFLTIYNFYDELNIKINNLIDYCIENYNDEVLIDTVIEINELYKSLVMNNLEI